MERPASPPFADHLPPRYRIQRVLSEGARAATVLAFDTGLRQAPAVLKVERLADEAAPGAETSFRRVCGTLATIQDDRLAVPYTFGTLTAGSGGILGYTARSYVNGTSLSAFALPMTTDVALFVTLQVCQGLDALHTRGLFHCDVKPENVIVRHAPGGRIDERSQCVLIDIAYPFKERSDDENAKVVKIEGLSIKAAQALRRHYRNIASATRTVDETDRDVVVQGAAIDLETNTRAAKEKNVSKLAVNKKTKQEFPLRPDRLQMAIDAGKSKAERNAILAILPEALKITYFRKAEEVAAKRLGSQEGKKAAPIAERRDLAVKTFAELGVKEETLLAHL